MCTQNLADLTALISESRRHRAFVVWKSNHRRYCCTVCNIVIYVMDHIVKDRLYLHSQLQRQIKSSVRFITHFKYVVLKQYFLSL